MCIRDSSRGASIEYTATTLQDRCGSFCSSNDIIGFRALEHLRKAKEIGMKDNDTLRYHLDNAIKLFEKIADDLSLPELYDATTDMLRLGYYPRTIEFLLNIANLTDKANLALQYVNNGSLEHDERKRYYDKRVSIYDMIFECLIDMDKYASREGLSALRMSSRAIDTSSTTIDFESLREESYSIALHYNDKLFHYNLYDWLATSKHEDRLLELDTDFILPYLQEKSKNSLKISNLYWVYQSKRSNFFEAAEILYSLATSDFELELSDRITCLSRANGFCNSTCPPNQKQRMVQLAGMIQELFEVAAVQDDILSLVRSDARIEQNIKDELVKQLNGEILALSSLFNDFADPLGYFEICLKIFKVSDFRDSEEIINKWNELFDSLKNELNATGKLEDSQKFVTLLSNVVIKVGRAVHSSDVVFPISNLFPIVCTLFSETLPKDHIKPGSIISIFISIGISYSKLYYILKDLIDTSDSANDLFKKEMVWLIKEWYKSDRKLRDIISFDEISKLEDYNADSDPIENYTKKTGNSI